MTDKETEAQTCKMSAQVNHLLTYSKVYDRSTDPSLANQILSYGKLELGHRASSQSVLGTGTCGSHSTLSIL